MTVKKDRKHHLRLHSDSVATATRTGRRRKPGGKPDVRRDETVDQFLRAYTDVTGWRLDTKEGLEGPNFDLQPADAFDGMMSAEDFDSGVLPMIGRGDATKLASAAAELAGLLQASQSALRSREAELAAFEARVGRLTSPRSDADRLQRILADGVAATDFDAAAVYLLSDDTSEIKLRCLFGLDPRRLIDPARTLADCRGDLEAMVCGVCKIDDLNAVLMDTWNCPEPEFGAAICATLNADDLPLGTLWLFAGEATEISDQQTAAARLTASHLATELCGGVASVPSVVSASGPNDEPGAKVGGGGRGDAAPDAAVRKTLPTDRLSVLDAMTRWQYESLPHGTQISEDFFVDGMIESGTTWSVGWHHWDVLPDGRIAFLMAEATDHSIAGAMTATFAKASVISHLGYRHDVEALLRHVGDSLWQMGVDGQTCSMLYATIDSETGDGELASAGTLQAIIGDRHGHRPLIAANARPLALDFEPSFSRAEFRMQKGETLLCGNQALAGIRSLDDLGNLLTAASTRRSKRPLAHLARELSGERITAERAAAVITRRP